MVVIIFTGCGCAADSYEYYSEGKLQSVAGDRTIVLENGSVLSGVYFASSCEKVIGNYYYFYKRSGFDGVAIVAYCERQPDYFEK